jgi:ubiquinone/menaquinone biosynthesis C-methylase UbiE
MISPTESNEPQAIIQRYARRPSSDRYSLLAPDIWQAVQERQRALLRLFREIGLTDLSQQRLFEVGCGTGNNLLELLRMGFASHNLSGIDLLPERCTQARHQLPSATIIHEGDALQLKLAPNSQHIILASTVFSSILDNNFQMLLAQTMWQWVQPGGGILWYDFTINNPSNPDVCGIPTRRLFKLFPNAKIRSNRITLAPPIARWVTTMHPALYTVCNTLPWMRTHVLAWLAKPLN